jgi:Flp pilus assembly protein TadG
MYNDVYAESFKGENEEYERQLAAARAAEEAAARAAEAAARAAEEAAARAAAENENKRIARQACFENGGNEESCAISGGRSRRRVRRRSRKSRRTKRYRK